MNVAIVHYHLKRGGVTRVIAAHLRGLDSASEGKDRVHVAVLHGGRHEGWPTELFSELRQLDLRLYEVRGLDYDEGSHCPSAELGSKLLERLRAIGFGSETTVVHVHNHSLGKNLSLPGALAAAARGGYALLLQVHDFAEDFRPHNYRRMMTALAPDRRGELTAQLYPQADHIHYAVLNRRDGAALREAGVDAARVHLLPNPVGEPRPLPPRGEARARLASSCGVPADRRLVLYPVRCIRRKNVGEAILWSRLAGDAMAFGFTLPPETLIERSPYHLWKALAAELKLPCYFELGVSPAVSYADNLAAADLILTTSVAEGFGLVFLESWLAGRPLLGRDLPEITADFVEAGLRLPMLRPELLVPVAWIGRAALEDALYSEYCRAMADYAQAAPSRVLFAQHLVGLLREGLVDFGMLDVSCQAQVVRRACHSDEKRDELLRLNPWIVEALAADEASTAETIRSNAELARRSFSLRGCGERLLRLYRQVHTSPRQERLDGLAHAGRLLELFLQLRRFRPVRITTECQNTTS